MSDIILSQALIQSFVEATEQFPVNFDDAWQWLEYSTKQKAKNRLLSAFECGIDYNINLSVKVQVEGERQVSRPFEEISLTANCFKELGMLAGTAKGKEIRRYFLECEKIAKQSVSMPERVEQKSAPLPTLPPHLESVQIADSIRHITDTLNDNSCLAQVLIDLAISPALLARAALPKATDLLLRAVGTDTSSPTPEQRSWKTQREQNPRLSPTPIAIRTVMKNHRITQTSVSVMSARLKLDKQIENAVTISQLSKFLAGKKSIWHDTLEGILVSISAICPAAMDELVNQCNLETDLRMALHNVLER